MTTCRARYRAEPFSFLKTVCRFVKKRETAEKNCITRDKFVQNKQE